MHPPSAVYSSCMIRINIITGCYDKHSDPMASMSEEQKEYEALELVKKAGSACQVSFVTMIKFQVIKIIRQSTHHHHHLFHITAIHSGYSHSTMGYGICQIHTTSFTSIAKGFCQYTSISYTRMKECYNKHKTSEQLK